MNDDEYAELFRQPPPPKSRPAGEASWQDVAAEAEALGRTLGDVLGDLLRVAAQPKSDDEMGVRWLREQLQSLLQELNRAVDGTPEVQPVRDAMVRMTESLRAAAERASEEVRPELLGLLRQANAELRRRAHLE